MATLLDVVAVRATGDPDVAVVECGEPGAGAPEIACDVLVAGGGTGGIAAALAAARATPLPGRRGFTVCLLEETDWIGGQLTAQGVPADRVQSVLAVDLDTRRWARIRPRIVIDATELGDLLPLVSAEYVIGAESKAETGEPHAQPVVPKVHCVQSLTYTFVLENTG